MIPNFNTNTICTIEYVHYHQSDHHLLAFKQNTIAWLGKVAGLRCRAPSQVSNHRRAVYTAIISTSSQILYQRFSRHKRRKLPFPCHVNQLYSQLSITTRTITFDTSWISRNLSERSRRLGACFAPKQLFETKKSWEKRALRPNFAPGFHFHQRSVDTVDV